MKYLFVLLLLTGCAATGQYESPCGPNEILFKGAYDTEYHCVDKWQLQERIGQIR